ncbi:MAG: nickel pincer cofactor biosynthesis protein LarC [Deltaproteobacteria bacterium]|nr:nickel pincer cofactor biosynthesis protein LarC [Candidatus Anaeroferrophillus wilburensis]MBN2888251.1 nickel pincer cofactor biosynthesis protein LarC [Deltaproteobacteria bacterium]
MMTERILFIDCFSGASGDMLLGAFLDLGFPAEMLRATLKPFGLDTTFRLQIEKAARHGIGGCQLSFPLIAGEQAAIPHRTFADICHLIESAPIEPVVKSLSIKIFALLAEAESRVHQIALEKVHFHEVGSIDSLADILGIAAAVEWCGADRILAPAIPLGTGLTTCQHGHLPVPVPAVVALLQGVPVRQTAIPAELVTPTGAAVLKSIVDEFEPSGRLTWTIDAVGYGVGSRNLAQQPNLLRLMLGSRTMGHQVEESSYASETVVGLETSIDDMTPEQISYLQGKLFAAGALDVVVQQVMMKKNRPGITLQVLAMPSDESPLIGCLFRHSSTLGIKKMPITRYVLERSQQTVTTALGPVRVKTGCDQTGAMFTVKPEFDDLAALADKHDLTLSAVEAQVMNSLAESSAEQQRAQPVNCSQPSGQS